MVDPDIYTRQQALVLALEAFRNRENFSADDVLNTAYLFYKFLTVEDLDEAE